MRNLTTRFDVWIIDASWSSNLHGDCQASDQRVSYVSEIPQQFLSVASDEWFTIVVYGYTEFDISFHYVSHWHNDRSETK